MEELKTFYEVRKTVRFELLPYYKTRIKLKGSGDYASFHSQIRHIHSEQFIEHFNWNQFCLDQYSGFIDQTKTISDFLNNQIINELNSNIAPKKSIQFDFKKSKGLRKNIPSLKNIQTFFSLKAKIIDMGNEYHGLLQFFNNLANQTGEAKKASEVSRGLRKLAYLNRNFLTIFVIMGQNKGKETDTEIVNNYITLIKNLGSDFEKLNNTIIISAENETMGTCFSKFSLNKYALHRRETTILKDKYEDKKRLYNCTVKKLIEENLMKDDRGVAITLDKKSITDLKLQLENNEISTRLHNFNFDRSLDDVVSELDAINGIILNQAIIKFTTEFKQGKNDIKLEYIYNDKERKKIPHITGINNKFYDDIIIKLQQGQTLEGYKYLNLLGQEKKDGSKIEQYNQLQANNFLRIIFRHKKITPDYNVIKQFRDVLAKWRGKVRQELSSSDREFINESMIKHYAKILEKDGCYFLALSAKENIGTGDIKNNKIQIETKSHTGNNGNDFTIYNYSQLHFPALEKLCLVKDGSLLKNNSLIALWNKYAYQKDKNTILNVDDFRSHIITNLNQLKENSGEDRTQYNDDIGQLTTIESIVDFINQKFYKLEKVCISSDDLFALADNGDIELYQIYNKDFNIYNDDFLSNEEGKRFEKYGEKTKTLQKTKRKPYKKDNLFTLYWRDAFKSLNTYLGSEGGLFFRAGDEETDTKRNHQRKFFVTFDLRFFKGQRNHNTALNKKQDEHILNSQIELTKKIISQVKQKDEIIIIGCDRGSIGEETNKNICFLSYSILKFKKKPEGGLELIEIIKTGDIIGFQRKENGGNWVESNSENNLIINYTKTLSSMRDDLNTEIAKQNSVRSLFSIINKKKGLTGLLVNTILELISAYKIDYVSIENLDNNFDNINSFKDQMLDTTISCVLYQNFETQLINKLQYIYNKEKGFIGQEQPLIKIDDLKKYSINSILLSCDLKEQYKDYKIIGNIIFVKAAGTSSTCFNCDASIKKHRLKCDNCGIDSDFKLKKYREIFMKKTIIKGCSIKGEASKHNFTNGIRAGLVIAKSAIGYIEKISISLPTTSPKSN